jgi:hypothetical protein
MIVPISSTKTIRYLPTFIPEPLPANKWKLKEYTGFAAYTLKRHLVNRKITKKPPP